MIIIKAQREWKELKRKTLNNEQRGWATQKKMFWKVGKNFHTYFYVLYSFSHNFRVSRIHARQHEKNCNVSMQCCFLCWVPACGALSCNSYNHTRLSFQTQTHKVSLSARSRSLTLFFTNSNNIIFIHIWIFQFSLVFRLKRFFFGFSFVLRGSNNKHFLLKCINCNKNNKLKQLQTVEASEVVGKLNKRKQQDRRKKDKINYLRNI